MEHRIELPEDVLKFFQRTGREGGLARKRNHSPEQLKAWARMGGRPKGSTKKRSEKGGTNGSL